MTESVSFTEQYTSLKALYKSMMFPKGNIQRWTMAEIDQLDVHFFYEIMDEFEQLEELSKEPEKEVYLSEIW